MCLCLLVIISAFFVCSTDGNSLFVLPAEDSEDGFVVVAALASTSGPLVCHLFFSLTAAAAASSGNINVCALKTTVCICVS